MRKRTSPTDQPTEKHSYRDADASKKKRRGKARSKKLSNNKPLSRFRICDASCVHNRMRMIEFRRDSDLISRVQCIVYAVHNKDPNDQVQMGFRSYFPRVQCIEYAVHNMIRMIEFRRDSDLISGRFICLQTNLGISRISVF